MGLPKKKFDNKIYTDPTGKEEVERVLRESDEHTTFLPPSIELADIDESFISLINTGDLAISVDGVEVPAFFMTNERWGEFAKTWVLTNSDMNINPPFITIKRASVQKGTAFGDGWNIPTNNTFQYLKVPTFENNEYGYDIYKIPQPTAVDVVYEVRLFTRYLQDVNVSLEHYLHTFKNRQIYVKPKGHFLATIMDEIGEESVLEDINGDRYYVSVFNMTVKGYLQDSDKFEKVKAINKVITKVTVSDGQATISPISDDTHEDDEATSLDLINKNVPNRQDNAVTVTENGVTVQLYAGESYTVVHNPVVIYDPNKDEYIELRDGDTYTLPEFNHYPSKVINPNNDTETLLNDGEEFTVPLFRKPKVTDRDITKELVEGENYIVVHLPVTVINPNNNTETLLEDGEEYIVPLFVKPQVEDNLWGTVAELGEGEIYTVKHLPVKVSNPNNGSEITLTDGDEYTVPLFVKPTVTDSLSGVVESLSEGEAYTIQHTPSKVTNPNDNTETLLNDGDEYTVPLFDKPTVTDKGVETKLAEGQVYNVARVPATVYNPNDNSETLLNDGESHTVPLFVKPTVTDNNQTSELAEGQNYTVVRTPAKVYNPNTDIETLLGNGEEFIVPLFAKPTVTDNGDVTELSEGQNFNVVRVPVKITNLNNGSEIFLSDGEEYVFQAFIKPTITDKGVTTELAEGQNHDVLRVPAKVFNPNTGIETLLGDGEEFTVPTFVKPTVTDKGVVVELAEGDNYNVVYGKATVVNDNNDTITYLNEGETYNVPLFVKPTVVDVNNNGSVVLNEGETYNVPDHTVNIVGKVESVGITITGSKVIKVGDKGSRNFDFSGTIVGYVLNTPIAGSVKFDLTKNGVSICRTSLPELVNQVNRKVVSPDWDIQINNGDSIKFNVVSADVENCQLTLLIKK
jgi:hypothetical protein